MNKQRVFLILDDISVNRLILNRFLKLFYKDAIIVEAVNGQECLQLYQELLDSLYPIDMIFLDYQLPDMNGKELAEMIRQRGYSGCIAMITASDNYTFNDLKESNLFNIVLKKPITKDIIFKECLKHIT